MSTDPSRRGFLLGAVAIAATPWVLRGEPVAVNPLRLLAGQAGPRLSVGYIEGSAEDGSLPAALEGARRIEPATALRAGDVGLRGGGVRLRIAGLTPAATQGELARSDAYLDALIPSPVPGSAGATLPFYAWTMRSGEPASSTTSFVVPTDREPRVGFSLDVRTAEQRGPATAVFTGGRGVGLAKLHRGVYLLGLRPEVWDVRRTLPSSDDPSWTSLASVVLIVDGA